MTDVHPVQGNDILIKFQGVINSARGGELIIVTPFITDFDMGGASVSSQMLKIARMTTQISLMTAPPSNPHHHGSLKEYAECRHCKEVARKITLLDIYDKFAKEILIKQNLHAKIYLSMDSKRKYNQCLAGSANLTLGGFRDLCELCFYIEDSVIMKKVMEYIGLWKTNRYGPRAETYRMWKTNLLSEYPYIQYLLMRR